MKKHKQLLKRILAVALSVVMTGTTFIVYEKEVSAETTVINAATHNMADGTLDLTSDCYAEGTSCLGHTVIGTTTENRIMVSGGEHKITLNGVNIALDSAHCIYLKSGAADITLQGENVLKAGAGYCGVRVSNSSTITIDGSGSLYTYGGENGAGIGGTNNATSCPITINGGTINALSSYGAGIGGGSYSHGGTVIISGGNVKATTSSQYGENIGHGGGSELASGTLTDASGQAIKLAMITLSGDAVTGTSVEAAVIDGVEGYGLKDVKTIDTNRLYFYLPASVKWIEVLDGFYTGTYDENADMTEFLLHGHQWQYTKEKDGVIVERCAAVDHGEPCNVITGGSVKLYPPMNNIYDGTAKEVVVVNALKYSPAKEVLVYHTKDGKAPVNAGTYTASVTVGEGTGAAVTTLTYTILKKQADAPEIIEKSYECSTRHTETINLQELLPADCGNVTYGAVTASGNVSFVTVPAVDAGMLTYGVGSHVKGATGSIQVTVETQNYENLTFTVAITRTACQHTGGTATCTKKAACEKCLEPYGKVDDTNHGETEVRGYVAETTEKDGYTGDTYCLDCGGKSAEGKVIDEIPNPTPTPIPTPSPSPSEELTPSPSASVKPSDEPAASPGVSEEPKESPNPSDNPSPTPTENVMKGDVDDNKAVTLADAQMTLKAALKIISLDEKQSKAADVDGKQGVALSDAQMILKYALKIINKFE